MNGFAICDLRLMRPLNVVAALLVFSSLLHTASMTSKRRLLLIALFAVVLGGLAWLLMPEPDPLFHGKPESVWIKSIVYNGDENQTRQWREFGPEGVRVLARAVDKADHPIQRVYRKVYRRFAAMLPGFLVRLLPDPRPVLRSGPPTSVILLLSRLGKNAQLAAPAVARALRSEDRGVRQSAISFFTWGEDENALLNHMEQKEKRRLLPDFIRAVETKIDDWGLRNNAALALKYYPEEAKIVTPVLIKALQDSSPWVRQCAAESLNRIAPELVTKAGVVPIVIRVLKDPDDQIAWRAAQLLGEMRQEPALAVPALIESLENTNALVAATAAQALLRFKEQAQMIIPALEKAAERKDTAGGWARSALQQLESHASANQGAPK